MIAKLQDGYKNNAMHVNPKHKWCMKKNFGQKHSFLTKIFQLQSIENQSNINRVRQTQTKNFNRNFDWSKNKFDRSKVWKNQIFEKHSILMQKLLKAHCLKIKKKGACVWDKKFFKNTWIQPRSSKIKIFRQIVLKNLNIKHICIEIKEL